MKTGTVNSTNKMVHDGSKGQKVTIIKSFFCNGEGHYLTKEIGEIPDMFVDEDADIKLTNCCNAYSTYHDTTLICKKCYKEVSEGEGDGNEKTQFTFEWNEKTNSYKAKNIGKKKVAKLKKLSEDEIVCILKNKLINDCTKEETKQVMDYAFGEEFMESDNKGHLVQYDCDGDCNYCDDSNCTNGECKEGV